MMSLVLLGPSGEGGGAYPAGMGRSAAFCRGAMQEEGETGQPMLPQSPHCSARLSTGKASTVACQTGMALGMAFPEHAVTML